MNIVKCANGHFFDSETYKLCPHCGAPIGGPSQPPAASPASAGKKEKKGLFSGLGGKKSKEKYTTQPDWGGQNGGFGPQGAYGSQGNYGPQGSFGAQNGYGPQNGFAPQGEVYNSGHEPVTDGSYPYPQQTPPAGPRTEDVPIDFGQAQNIGPNILNTSKTLDFWQTSSGGSIVQPEVSAQPQNVPETAPPAAPSVPEPPVNTPVPQPVSEAPQASAPQPVSSLLNEVRQASASDEGKTLSYFSSVTGAAAASPVGPGTPAQPAAPKAIDPVVGWLVSIKGPHFGESFGIHSGMNSIGRNASNRIVLDRDPAVSREKHAFITYEPKHRCFYVKPGDSSGLVYVNEDYITENRQINVRDVLEIGGSKLIFVPFCTEEFGWEDVLNN